MSQPSGFHDEVQPNHVCHLKKSLYSLKRSPKAWFKRLRDFLIKIGFKEGLSDSSLFVYINDDVRTFLLVYVDDIVVTSSSNPHIDQIVCKLAAEFSIKDLRQLTFFLGIHVSCIDEGLFLSLQQYVTNLLHEENLTNLKAAVSPMEPKISLIESDAPYLSLDDTKKYHRILGSLQYLITTRLDISYAVSKLAQFFTKPNFDHLQTLQRVLRYISGNPFQGLLLRPIS